MQNVSNQPTKKSSFASVLNERPLKKIVKIKEMRSVERVNGAAVALPFAVVEAVNARFTNTLYGYFIGNRLSFPLVENYVKNAWAKYGLKRIQMHEEFFLIQFNTHEGMESVMENGPWLIRLVPLILNEWTPNTILKKDEIKCAHVWVKIHHVPIVAYSEIGLSLITTQIGKPIMLDSYTSNMCLNSWGRSTYARALIEISAKTELQKSMVIAIPLSNKVGHTFVTIDIEYEWTPPRCATCKVFDHVDEKCPKLPKVDPPNQVVDDGFTEVKRKKKVKSKQAAKRQVEGVRLSKPPLNLQYRCVGNGESSKNKAHIVKEPSMPSVDMSCGEGLKTRNMVTCVNMANSVSELSEENASTWEDNDGTSLKADLNIINDSDSEEVDEYIMIPKKIVHSLKTVNDQGASTPLDDVSS
ncbi:retrovirus-related pol polyprotein from transposon 17.6 [Tanacetum coccineum]